MEQELVNLTNEEFEEKLERAKKLFQLYNDVTFGSKIEAAKSRIVLNQIL